MSFLSPIVLGALAAVGVPVVIHLFNKFQTRVTDWGAMRFLLESVQKNQKKVKMDDLILMILRCLAVAFLVFAFARPALKGLGIGGQCGGNVTAVILLDQSASMDQGDGGVTRFEQAKNEVRQWLDKVDSQSSVALYLGATRTTPVIGKPVNDFALFRKSLDEAKVSDYGSDLSQGLRLALESLKTVPGGGKQVRIYTDGQASAFLQREEMIKLARENPDVSIQPIVVGKQATDNMGIVLFQPEAGAVAVGQQVDFRVQVLNAGSAVANEVKVDFRVDGNVSAGSTAIPSIPAGETGGAQVSLSFDKPGFHRVTATISADGFADDNRRDVAIQVAHRVEVALAAEDQPNGERDESVRFLSHALVPVTKDQAAGFYLIPASMHPGDLPVIVGQTGEDRPKAVFLCAAGDVPDDVAAALDTYVKGGGNLVVFPGTDADVTRWTDDSAFGKLLPATLAAAESAPRTWQVRDFTHPVTAFWNDPANGSLGGLKFSRYCPMTLRKSGSPSVVVSYSDSLPAIAEWTHGSGTVVLFSAGLSRDWTNQAFHPSFVPFIGRLMQYFDREQTARLVLSPGEIFRKPVEERFRGKDFAVRRPGSETSRTAGQIISEGDSTFLRYSGTEVAGPYEIAVEGEPVAAFAVQMDGAESDLRPVEAAVLADLTDVPRDKSGKAAAAPMVVTREFWTPLMWCVLALLVAEAGFAHHLARARA
ncbi:MAG: BatA domain-containing protein [Verrucomicrobiota bacterium]